MTKIPGPGFAVKVLLLITAVCCLQAEDSQDQNDKSLLSFFRGLYQNEPADSPARYALNQIASRHSWRAFHILKRDWSSTPADRQQARNHLIGLKAEIERGLNWPIKKPPTFNIPKAKEPPKIDGKLDDAVWQEALTIKGEYPLNSPRYENMTSVWMMTYDKRNIYIGTRFKDDNQIGINYVPKKSGPWQGDSLEVFLMPSKRLKDYREIVVGCNGAQFSSLHVSNKWGTFINGTLNENVKTIKSKVVSDKSGFTVEIAVPFKDLPNYMLGNAPQPGEKIYFAFARTNTSKKSKPASFFTAFPLMYNSHNIFGYAKGIFK